MGQGASKLKRHTATVPALQRNNQIDLCWSPGANYLVRAPSFLGGSDLPCGTVLMVPGSVLTDPFVRIKGFDGCPGFSRHMREHQLRAAAAQVARNLCSMGGRCHRHCETGSKVWGWGGGRHMVPCCRLQTRSQGRSTSIDGTRCKPNHLV